MQSPNSFSPDSENIIGKIPVIVTVEIICGAICAYIWYYTVSAQKFAINYGRIIDHAEWWRMVSGTLSHVNLMHLAFNLVSLWNDQNIEKGLGSLMYLELTFLIFLYSNLTMMFAYFIQSRYCDQSERVNNVWTIGYSGILFGFMSFRCILYNGTMGVFGFSIPYYIGPFLLLGLISMMVPNASFIGHLSGIIWGFVCGSSLFFESFWNPKVNRIHLWFWISLLGFVLLMLYSAQKSKMFGLTERIASVLSPKPSSTRIVNGVMVRSDSNSRSSDVP